MKYLTLVVMALLLVPLAIPCVSAANRTNQSTDWVHSFDQWAGQKDMSEYSNTPKPEPIHTMNETIARLYPNMTACGNNGCMVNRPCSFPFIRCESPLTLMVIYNVNATNPGQPGPVIGYSLGGWPLQNPVYILGAGKLDLFRPFGDFAGMFS
ncbi:MAG: hypothetical protein M0Q91_06400 [Methanoregula sp.]|nr:hypothetical protein [Methanoregula sp.]